MNMKTFVDGKFREFSNYDNIRSIPSIIDGLKVSQRKAIYGALHATKLCTVETLAVNACGATAYHHGGTSMESTVVGLAQDFPGSNNFPLLLKDGQFGNRLDHDSGAPRYIKAELHPDFYKMFQKYDLSIVPKQREDDQEIEPEFFVPVLPMCLINSSAGIATGFATDILSHKIEDIKQAVQDVLTYGSCQQKLVPYFNDYTGSVEMEEVDGRRQIIIKGILKVENTTTIRITEVPPKWQSKKYRDKVLNELMDKKIHGIPVVKDYDNNSTEKGWDIVVTVPRSVTLWSNEKLLNEFKLVQRMTQNIVLWDTTNQLKQYKNAEEVVEEFVKFRLEWYEIRKKSLIEDSSAECRWLKMKAAFIEWWIENQEVAVQKSKKDVVLWMIDELSKNLKTTITTEESIKLLGINILNLTIDEREKSLNLVAKKVKEITAIEEKAVVDFWNDDMKYF